MKLAAVTWELRKHKCSSRRGLDIGKFLIDRIYLPGDPANCYFAIIHYIVCVVVVFFVGWQQFDVRKEVAVVVGCG